MTKTGKQLKKGIQRNIELQSLVLKYKNDATVNLVTKK